MPLDFARLEADLLAKGDSQRSTLSPYNSQRTILLDSSQHDIGGLIIPPSASSLLGGPVGGLENFGIHGDLGGGTRVNISGLDDDLGLAIDEDGTLRMPDEPPRRTTGQIQGVEREASANSHRLPSAGDAEPGAQGIVSTLTSCDSLIG